MADEKWSVGRVIGRDTEQQHRVPGETEGRIKGVLGNSASGRTMDEIVTMLYRRADSFRDRLV